MANLHTDFTKSSAEFLRDTLNPAIFDRVQDIFPSFGFVPYKGGYASPCKLDGSASKDHRRDKSVITRRYPSRVLEQGGESVSLIDLYMRLHGLNFKEAVEQLCGLCGLQPPTPEDSEAYKAYRQRIEGVTALAASMQATLYQPAGKDVLAYLRGRGYDDDFITFAGFGALTPEAAGQMQALGLWHLPGGLDSPGNPYRLVIPYLNSGEIQGFVLRAIDGSTKPKYKDTCVSERATKRYCLFGATGLKLTGNKDTDRDVLVVEGEIDCLRAQYAGIPNVVAAAGGVLSTEALTQLKARGVQRVTLLLDTEDTPEKTEAEIHPKIERAICAIESAGLSAWIAALPYEGGKSDPDSYLKAHSGAELLAVVQAALPAYKWRYERLKAAEPGAGMEATERDIDTFRRKVVDLCGRYSLPAAESIARDFATSLDNYISAAALLDEVRAIRQVREAAANDRKARAEAEKALKDKQAQDVATARLISEAKELADGGNPAAARALLHSHLTKVEEMSTEAEDAALFASPALDDIQAALHDCPEGIPTAYTFGEGNRTEALLLPMGALTYICAPTNHGKTRMLENLALQAVANAGHKGAVLYITMEEDINKTRLQLLNVYANTYLSANNLRTLQSYYRGNTQYIDTTADMQTFKAKESEFWRLLTGGALRVVYSHLDSARLITAIRRQCRQYPVTAVFIDYVQRLRIKGSRATRKEELQEICDQLMTLAIDTRTAIVLAAQVNRECPSPLDMSPQNIADASDIEHSANQIIMLWNSSKPVLPKTNTYYTDTARENLSKHALNLQARGFECKQPGRFYAVLAKSRECESGLEAVFDFDGNTGRISQDNPVLSEEDMKI